MLKSLAEGLVDTLGLVITLGLLSGLLLESLTLFSGNVQLSVAIVDVSNSFILSHINITYALQISFLQTKASNRSQRPGTLRELLARGDIILGWPVMKVGLTYIQC